MTPVLRIAVEGDEVEVVGRRDVVKKAMDTSLLNYVEIDGYVVAQFRDPVQHAGRQAANAAVRVTRGLDWLGLRRLELNAIPRGE